MIETGDGRKRGASSQPNASRATGRRRLPGVSLRQGAVKQARHESGLSLAQLGKGHVTAPAIYLIETGRTRPSLPTLEHIARRTGKPVEYFLADPTGGIDDAQSGLLELESLIAATQWSDAVALGERLLKLGSSAHRLGRIRYHIGFALLNLARPHDAEVYLEQAHTHFEAVDDRLMLAECLGAQACVAQLAMKPGGVELAERALAVLRTLDPVPHTTEAKLLGFLGNARCNNKEWDLAISAYQEAIDAAGMVYDLRRLAMTYGGMCNAYRETGQIEAAARYANRSIALFEVLRDQLNLARIENNLGLILLSKGDHAQAREHLDRSLGLHEESDLQIGRSHVLLSLAELNLHEGHVARSRELALEALDLAERLDERPNVAEAHIWIGLVADHDADIERCDHEFQLAMSELQAIGAEERLLRCHGIYAEVLERRGQMDQAYVHMKKAFSASRPGLLHREDEDEAQKASLA